MRVDEHSPAEQVSSTAARATESQRIHVDTTATSGATSGAAAAASGDRVDLSGLTGRISQTMQALANQSAQRVGQLRKDYRAGRCQPDAQQIASAMARS